MTDILTELSRVLEDRKGRDPGSSYVASLYAEGVDVILKKLGEEATEVVIAAKADDRNAIIHEMADLWFHSLVLLAYRDITPDAVLDELKSRSGRSGLEEKAGRGQ